MAGLVDSTKSEKNTGVVSQHLAFLKVVAGPFKSLFNFSNE
jgi:hypothetical protein